MTAASDQYTAKDIQILEGLEAVRRRPGMYIGDTGTRGLHHLVFEVVDNSIDEAMAGMCDHITITIHDDNHVSVADNGRGIPVDPHPQTGRPAAEVVLTTLHAGGKFDKKSYQVSGGLHGVGISVVNGLSEWLNLTVWRNRQIWTQKYRQGKPVTDLCCGDPTENQGTLIEFFPDAEIFEDVEFSWDILAGRFREMAFLNPGLTIDLKDIPAGKEKSFHYEGGISSFVEYLNRGKSSLYSPPVVIRGEREGVSVEIGLQYNDSYLERVFAFANLIHTMEGGTHVSGFRTALTRAVNESARRNKAIKDKDPNLSGDDLREGLTAVISVKLPEPQFEGQTKTKLGNGEIKGIVDSIFYDGLMVEFDERPDILKPVVEKALKARLAREAAKKARELVRRKTAMAGLDLPGKLADCSSRNPEETEIYIVEGDSAGGSAKQGRDRHFQAILPLRGKILNVEKARIDKALDNNEIRTIIQALGAGVGDDFTTDKLRYNKVFIMSVDGEEPVLVKDPFGSIHQVRTGDFIDDAIDGSLCPDGYEVMCFDLETNHTGFRPIKEVIRHDIEEPLYEIKTAYGRNVRVTSSHSVFALENGEVTLKKGSEIAEGDILVAPRSLNMEGKAPRRLDLLEELFKRKEKVEFNLYVRGKAVEEMIKEEILREYSDKPELSEKRVEISENVRETLRGARKECGLANSALCEKTGIRQPVTFYSWEKGSSKPTVTHFCNYARAVGLDPEELMDRVRVEESHLENVWKRQYKGSCSNRVKPYIRIQDLSPAGMKSLEDKDVVLTPEHYASRTLHRDIPVDEDLMTILGFFAAEGSMDQRQGVRFAIGANNESLRNEVCDRFARVFGIDLHWYPGKNGRCGELKVLNSPLAAVFRLVFGFDGARSYSKKIPDIVFNVDTELRQAYLRGYFLGDGTIRNSGISITTTSREMASGVMFLLSSLGVVATLHSREPSGATGFIRGKPITTRRGYHTVTVSASDDLRTIEAVWRDHHLSENLQSKLKTGYSNNGNRRFVPLKGDLMGLKVTGVREIEPSSGWVYDFSVETDENFICGMGGICCHNTDADVDGAHIRTLLLTLFYRFMPELIEKGHLYIAQPPLYRVQAGREAHYCFSDKELSVLRKELKQRKYSLQRYKGLGEMNPQQLWETTMDPATRTCKRVELEDAVSADEFFSILMGDKVEPRREFIETHAREVRNLDV